MPIKVQSRVICPQPILYSLTIVLLTNHLFPPPFTDVNTSSSFTPVLQPCVPLSAVFLLFLPSWWRCLTNSFLTPLSLSLIKSTLPSLIPLSWQWWMAAFTRLSPLHISLPIRLTTHIHTHWLSILLSLHLPQTLALFLPSFTLIRSVAASIFSSNPTPLLPPSCALFSHFLVFFCLSPSRLAFFRVRHSLSVFIPSTDTTLPWAFYTFWMTKEDNTTKGWQRSDTIKRMSGLTVHTTAARRGYVGVLLFLAWRERECVCVCWPPCNYDGVVCSQ